MSKLTDMQNIGDVLSDQLKRVGIESPEDLRKAGSREAFTRIRAQEEPDACLSKLNALEGAVQNVRWHHLSPEDKAELKTFFDAPD